MFQTVFFFSMFHYFDAEYVRVYFIVGTKSQSSVNVAKCNISGFMFGSIIFITLHLHSINRMVTRFPRKNITFQMQFLFFTTGWCCILVTIQNS